MTHILENNSIKLAVSDIGGEPRSLVTKKSGREYLYDATPSGGTTRPPFSSPSRDVSARASTILTARSTQCQFTVS